MSERVLALNPARRWVDTHSASYRWVAALTASAALAAGIVLALHHPTQPQIALTAFALWCLVALRWPRAWLFVLPACLPAASFAPWTGWLAFDEFDLILMGTVAAGYAALALPANDRPASSASPRIIPRRLLIPSLLCVAAASLALVRGLVADGDAPTGWYDGYSSSLNALRIGKSLLGALLLAPLMRHALRRSPTGALRSVGAGMLVGTGIVVAAVAEERMAYVGLFDFTQAYRTTALFWEMHVGGAAIDGYLALACPFVAWAVLRSRTPLGWTASAILALLAEYACLTTFSRGLYLAILGGLVVLWLGLRPPPARATRPRWRRRADLVLAAMLVAQLVAVTGAESFMRTRLKGTQGDLARRIAHWRHGIDLLRSPTDWWLGKGAGRLPSEYARSVPEDELPGSARVVPGVEGGLLSLSGPGHLTALAGRFAMTQRVPVEPNGYRVAFDVHVERPVRLGISVCTMHLLYEGNCQRASVQVLPGATAWQRMALPLAGRHLDVAAWPWRTAVFAITVLDVDATAELDNISLASAGVANVLHNADFSQGFAYWFPVAKDYFVPWHIDNFYLELLIEQGVLGLASVALLLGSTLVSLRSAGRRGSALAPFLTASLVGALLVGTVSSLLDVPRVAFLLFFLALMSIQVGADADDSGPH